MINLLSGLLLIAFGIWIWFYSGTFPSLPEGYPGPALFPKVIAVGLTFSGLVLILGRLKKSARPDVSDGGSSGVGWPGWLRLLLGVVLVCSYPFLQGLLGFVPTLSLLSLVVALLLGARLIHAVPTALISALLIYWLFTGLLGVPL